jgi:hypothetical protein
LKIYGKKPILLTTVSIIYEPKRRDVKYDVVNVEWNVNVCRIVPTTVLRTGILVYTVVTLSFPHLNNLNNLIILIYILVVPNIWQIKNSF